MAKGLLNPPVQVMFGSKKKYKNNNNNNNNKNKLRKIMRNIKEIKYN